MCNFHNCFPQTSSWSSQGLSLTSPPFCLLIYPSINPFLHHSLQAVFDFHLQEIYFLKIFTESDYTLYILLVVLPRCLAQILSMISEWLHQSSRPMKQGWDKEGTKVDYDSRDGKEAKTDTVLRDMKRS